MNYTLASATILLQLTFLFAGKDFLTLMNLSDVSLQIAGGVILFLIALKMIFPSAAHAEEELEGEPLIVPLAIPALVEPSALATVMLLRGFKAVAKQI